MRAAGVRGSAHIDFVSIGASVTTLAAAIDAVKLDDRYISQLVSEYFTTVGFDGALIRAREMPPSAWYALMREAGKNGFVRDLGAAIREYGLDEDDFTGEGRPLYEEFTLSKKNRSPLTQAMLGVETLYSDMRGLSQEVDRLLASGKPPKNPPCYVFEAAARQNIYFDAALLMQALHSAGQLKSGCYAHVRLDELVSRSGGEAMLGAIYGIYAAGAVVVTLESAGHLELACETAKEWRGKTRTVFHAPAKLSAKLRALMGGVPIVTFEYVTGGDRAPESAGGCVRELEELVGLAETKATVKNILNYAKAQSLYAAAGIEKKLSMHMIFTGNPGAAKTTVARLVARILHENGIVSNPELTEVGRADLVGQYVGWTAVQVREAFERADGGILFIDEAYSLVDEPGGFGNEAIATIVQEMENRRDDVIVIFAGYPDEMERFLKKNPGLRSRISFSVHFPDYSPAELYEILELLVKKDGLLLGGDVRGKVRPMLERAVTVKEFGNGRYARNLLEHARMRQATRLVETRRRDLSDETVRTLVADDFEDVLPDTTEKRRIGFV
jgi:hypothetical protein